MAWWECRPHWDHYLCTTTLQIQVASHFLTVSLIICEHTVYAQWLNLSLEAERTDHAATSSCFGLSQRERLTPLDVGLLCSITHLCCSLSRGWVTNTDRWCTKTHCEQEALFKRGWWCDFHLSAFPKLDREMDAVQGVCVFAEVSSLTKYDHILLHGFI